MNNNYASEQKSTTSRSSSGFNPLEILQRLRAASRTDEYPHFHQQLGQQQAQQQPINAVNNNTSSNNASDYSGVMEKRKFAPIGLFSNQQTSSDQQQQTSSRSSVPIKFSNIKISINHGSSHASGSETTSEADTAAVPEESNKMKRWSYSDSRKTPRSRLVELITPSLEDLSGSNNNNNNESETSFQTFDKSTASSADTRPITTELDLNARQLTELTNQQLTAQDLTKVLKQLGRLEELETRNDMLLYQVNDLTTKNQELQEKNNTLEKEKAQLEKEKAEMLRKEQSTKKLVEVLSHLEVIIEDLKTRNKILDQEKSNLAQLLEQERQLRVTYEQQWTPQHNLLRRSYNGSYPPTLTGIAEGKLDFWSPDDSSRFVDLHPRGFEYEEKEEEKLQIVDSNLVETETRRSRSNGRSNNRIGSTTTTTEVPRSTRVATVPPKKTIPAVKREQTESQPTNKPKKKTGNNTNTSYQAIAQKKQRATAAKRSAPTSGAGGPFVGHVQHNNAASLSPPASARSPVLKIDLESIL